MMNKRKKFELKKKNSKMLKKLLSVAKLFQIIAAPKFSLISFYKFEISYLNFARVRTLKDCNEQNNKRSKRDLRKNSHASSQNKTN